jgi:hypothetical protein
MPVSWWLLRLWLTGSHLLYGGRDHLPGIITFRYRAPRRQQLLYLRMEGFLVDQRFVVFNRTSHTTGALIVWTNPRCTVTMVHNLCFTSPISLLLV